MQIIVPLAKSPHAEGRLGARESQDWHQALALAVRLLRKDPRSKLLIVSGFKHLSLSDGSDVDHYLHALTHKLSVNDDDIVVIRLGMTTIEQLELARDYADKMGGKLMIVSTWLHYPRVRWLCRGKGYDHQWAFGIPRPSEAFWDLLLAVIFPLIDLCGGRAWFAKRSHERRAAGKL